jgi:aspartate/methionine/tyrosine aminotransferase
MKSSLSNHPVFLGLLLESPLLCNGFIFTKPLSLPPTEGLNPKRATLFASSIQKESITTFLALDNNGEEDDIVETVDRAPCFDGICKSTPVDGDVAAMITETNAHDNSNINEKQSSSSGGYHAAGEAMLRLGTMTGPTVWSEFGRLSQEYDVANLGQGFPDWLPPDFAVESLVSATIDSTKQSPHQYTRTAGHPNLVKQLARRYSKHMHRTIDPMNEVAVTVGASQALYLCLQTLVKPGDEVILFEPFFDLYVNQIKLAGGTPVYVPLTFVPYSEDNGEVTGGEWILEPEKLEQAISPKTRAIILNSPHNPTGKVFTLTEMKHISEKVIAAGPQCVVISDEVYKYIVHSPPPQEELLDAGGSCPGHIHFASLPGMWERTITVSSAGKTFSATGWQVGWCIAPSHLISPIHQLVRYLYMLLSVAYVSFIYDIN